MLISQVEGLLDFGLFGDGCGIFEFYAQFVAGCSGVGSVCEAGLWVFGALSVLAPFLKVFLSPRSILAFQHTWDLRIGSC